MPSTGAARIDGVTAWLADGARSAATPPLVLDELCQRLVATGVPLWRVAVFVRTLHPDIMGRRFLWQEGAGVTILEAAYDVLEAPVFRDSPVAHVTHSGERLRIVVQDSATASMSPRVVSSRPTTSSIVSRPSAKSQ